jgi:hypothetical protein
MHYRKAFLLFIGLAFCIVGHSFAQSVKKDSASSGVLIDMSYAAQLPAGNLAQRFGFNSNIQLAVYYKFSSNWMVGIQGAFISGNQLRETGILDSIATQDNNIIANDGNYSSIKYFERGYDIQLTVGKIIPLDKKNLNSGLMFTLSSGYLRHHVRIETPSDWTPQVAGDYLLGYERLTAGVCVTEFAGYQYISKNRIVNFYAGLEFTQGFTKSLEYDFDLRSMNTSLRYDLLNGIRVGWILPILKKSANNVFYTH